MRYIAVVAAALALASCGTAVKWQKQGVGAAEQQKDETDCTSRANREATIPTAGAAGTTTGTPVASQQARIQTYDAQAFEECMRTRGYERVPARPPG